MKVAVVICSILSDFYGNQYYGRRMIVKDSEQQDGRSLEQEGTHSEFKSNGNVSTNSNNEEKQPSHWNNNPNKETHQVVSFRWIILSSSSIAYMNNWYGRHVQEVGILSQQQLWRWWSRSISPTVMHKSILEPSVAIAATTAVMKQEQQTTTTIQIMHQFTRNVDGTLVLLGPLERKLC